MKISRRRLLYLTAAAAALPALPTTARTENYPAWPVRWIVPHAAGGASDVCARLIGGWLAKRLGQPFVIENRAGTGGSIGTEAVVNSPPDGHTLLLAGSFNAVGATLYEKLSYNFIRDIAPVAGIMRNPLVMVVSSTITATTVGEFIAYAKANPGKLTVGSSGNGTPQHLAGELFKMMAGVDMVHVPYRGSAGLLTDLLRGEVHVTFEPMLSSLEHVKAGKLRALAVTTAARSEALPEIPTVADLLPGYEYTGWVGMGAPAGTPVEIVERLNTEINAGLADPKIKARLTELGGTPLVLSPSELGKLIAEQTDRWARVIRTANIKPD